MAFFSRRRPATSTTAPTINEASAGRSNSLSYRALEPRVVFDGLFETTVDELTEVYENAIPRLLGAGLSGEDV